MTGIRDVVDRVDDFALKPQNYARVVIKAEKCKARFVANYLNSELGRATREAGKTGTVIPKFNKATLLGFRVFIPELATQRRLLDIEAKITADRSTLAGLQNELQEVGRDLWSRPKEIQAVEARL